MYVHNKLKIFKINISVKTTHNLAVYSIITSLYSSVKCDILFPTLNIPHHILLTF